MKTNPLNNIVGGSFSEPFRVQKQNTDEEIVSLQQRDVFEEAASVKNKNIEILKKELCSNPGLRDDQIRQKLLDILILKNKKSLIFEDRDFAALEKEFGFFSMLGNQEHRKRIIAQLHTFKNEIYNRIASANTVEELSGWPIIKGAELDKKMISAALDQNFKLVEGLLDRGGNPGAESKERFNILQIAALFGHRDMAKQFWSKGVTLESSNGRSILPKLIEKKRFDLVEDFIRFGATLFSARKRLNKDSYICTSFVEQIPPGPLRELAMQRLNIQRLPYERLTALELLAKHPEYEDLAKAVEEDALKQFHVKGDINDIVLYLSEFPQFSKLENILIEKGQESHFEQLTKEHLERRDHLSSIRARYFLKGRYFLAHQERELAIQCFAKATERCLALARVYEELSLGSMKDVYSARTLAQEAVRFMGHAYTPPKELSMSIEHIKKTRQILSQAKSLTEEQSTFYLHVLVKQLMDSLGVDYEQATELVVLREKELKALRDSILSNHVEQLKDLISKGVDLSRIDSNGNTPLTRAIIEGSENIIRELLEQGVDTTQSDRHGRQPLEIAIKAKYPRPKTVELLVQHGADITRVGNLSTELQSALLRGMAKRLYKYPEEAFVFFTEANRDQMKLLKEEKQLPALPYEPFEKIAQKILQQFKRFFSKEEFFWFSDERSRPFTTSELEEHLEEVLENVEIERSDLAGVPKDPNQRAQFYARMKNMLQHIALYLSDKKVPQNNKKTALMQIIQGGIQCGTRQFQETLSAIKILMPEGNDQENLEGTEKSPREQIDAVLFDFRWRIFNELPRHFGFNTVHSYNYMLKEIGADIKIAGSEESYDDPILPKNLPDKKTLLEEFYRRYTPSSIFCEIKKRLKTKEISPTVFSEFVGQQSGEDDDDYVLKEDGSFAEVALPYCLMTSRILTAKQNSEMDPLLRELGFSIERAPEVMRKAAQHFKDSPRWEPYLKTDKPLLLPVNKPLTEQDHIIAGELLMQFKIADEEYTQEAAQFLAANKQFQEKTGRNLSFEQAMHLVKSIMLLEESP